MSQTQIWFAHTWCYSRQKLSNNLIDFLIFLSVNKCRISLKTVTGIGLLVIRKIENSCKCWIFRIYVKLKKTRKIRDKSKVDT